MMNSIQELIDIHIDIENLKTQYSTLKKFGDYGPNMEDDDSLCKYVLHRLRDTRDDLVERYCEMIAVIDSLRDQLRGEEELFRSEDLR